MLSDAADTLIQAARDSKTTDADMQAAGQSFFESAKTASRDDTNAALRTLKDHFNLENPSRGAYLALICGGLIERGGDSMIIAKPLTEQLTELISATAELANACVDQIRDSENQDENSTEDFEKIRVQTAQTMPHQNAAWEALKIFWRPAIAVFSRNSESRSAARHLREFASQVSDYHEAGHWLKMMLTVLDNEPIVVIEPSTSLGIQGRISGIVDNFQLNTILMDVFPKQGWFARRRVSRRVADIARGNGPQQSHHMVSSTWNLYTWKAIESNLNLPESGDYSASTHWIWNEGTPADIPVFDQHRVILLGPPTYKRVWQSLRIFANLPGNLEVVRKLTKVEVNNWLKRLFDAKQSGE